MWLALVEPDPGVCPATLGELLWSVRGLTASPDDPAVTHILPWIGMRTADAGFVPWLASQTDLLAEDWSIVPS